MFLLNSCLGQFSAACVCRHTFSRSYGVILPSSLTMLLPSALEFSSHPPVSVYGTGLWKTIAAFLGSLFSEFPTFASVYIIALSLLEGFSSQATWLLIPSIPYLVHLLACVPTVLFPQGTGISTCCPSTTTLVLALGPDLPRADQLYSGNLRYSA